jgi:hypothetical protein
MEVFKGYRCYRVAVVLIVVLLRKNSVASDMVDVRRHAQVADMWVCTG